MGKMLDYKDPDREALMQSVDSFKDRFAKEMLTVNREEIITEIKKTEKKPSKLKVLLNNILNVIS